MDTRISSWVFLSSREYELIAHILKMPSRLSGSVETNRLVVVLGGTKVYLATDEVVQEYNLKSELFKPIVGGSDIK